MLPSRLIIFSFLSLAALSPTRAAEPLIGVVAPLSGPSEILGRQIAAGALAASAAANIPLVSADDQCNATGGRAAASQMVERKASVVIGFLCSESLEAALPILKDANIPVITVGVRTVSLTDNHQKTQWPLLRLAPRADTEAAAVSSLLTPLWRDKLFAIVDDGTIGGRQLSEAFRLGIEQAGLKAVFVDNYRPDVENQAALVRRLRNAGATHAFIGGSRQDIAIIARDAKAIDFDLTIAGGDNLRTEQSDVSLTPGTMMIGLPEWADIAPNPVLDALTAKSVIADGYVLPSYAAVEIAAAVLASMGDKAPLFDEFTSRDFTTALGPVKFDAKGDLTASLYGAYRFDGTRFIPLESK